MIFQYKNFKFLYKNFDDSIKIRLIKSINDDYNPTFIDFPDKIDGLSVTDIDFMLFWKCNINFTINYVKYIKFPSQLNCLPKYILTNHMVDRFNSLKYVKVNNIFVKFNNNGFYLL